jgi:hypothetical protein
MANGAQTATPLLEAEHNDMDAEQYLAEIVDPTIADYEATRTRSDTPSWHAPRCSTRLTTCNIPIETETCASG